MIGRIVMYLVIVGLGLFVLTATFLVEGGGKSTAIIGTITVGDLVERPGDYDDREITTMGTLEFDEADGIYYVTQSNERLRLDEPADIAGLIDTEVEVTGQLQYDDDGVYLEADRVRSTEE